MICCGRVKIEAGTDEKAAAKIKTWAVDVQAEFCVKEQLWKCKKRYHPFFY